MILYHWTHHASPGELYTTGLCPSKSEGKRPVIWLCRRALVQSVLLHLCRTQHRTAYAYHLIELDIPVSMLKRTRIHGVFTCSALIPPHMLRRHSDYNDNRRTQPATSDVNQLRRRAHIDSVQSRKDK